MPKLYTEREMALAKREVYVQGKVAAYQTGGYAYDVQTLAKNAEVKFPLPKITRPRMEWSPGGEYQLRYMNGELQERCARSGSVVWRTARNWNLDKAFMTIIRNLMALPTETVEDDGTGDNT